ncbi:MAG TPA: hypothetical protein VHX63_08245 [Acidobacteriaceae bacterium]|nr:hypothetical protein [Acidobacteriaceae bacterium]
MASDRVPNGTKNRSRWTMGVSAAVFASTILPLLLFLRRFPRLAPVAVDSADAFYYLTVARNSLHTTFYSFDGTYPTNGFHPVWQFLLYTAMRWNVLKPADPDVTLHRLFIGNALLLSVGFALLAVFCTRHLRRQWLAFPAVCPGFLWFAVALIAPAYLSNWSYLNGMETSVELICLGLTLLTFTTDGSSNFRLQLSMFFFGLTVLCRLDDVFFLLPILFLVWTSRHGRPMRRTILAAALPLTMIAAYLVYNRISVGVFMPTSGASKAALSIGLNVLFVLQMILPVQWNVSPAMNWFPETFMRVFQMIVPAIICSVFLFRRGWRRFDLIGALCLGVLLKSLYNFVNVGLYEQGSWYFGASIFVANLVIALWLDRTAHSVQPVDAKDVGPNPWIAAVVGTIFVGICFNIYVNHIIASGTGREALSILDHRETLRAMVQHEGSDRFIDMDDGVLAYATAMPALSGLGLVLDPEAAQALAHGHFFDIALQRHYSLMMASGLSRTVIDSVLASNKHGSKSSMDLISAHEFDHYALTPVAFDPTSGVELYRITPKH